MHPYIVHFDVDENIKPYLKGKQYSFSLIKNNLQKIRNKEKIKAVTIKSQSLINENILKALPTLQLIITRTVGVDHINLKTCKEHKIIIQHIIDYGSQNIAEHALGLLLAGARNIIQANEQVHNGIFSYQNFLGVSLKNKTIGVIGTGKIGLALIKLIKSFDMKILAYDICQNQKEAKNLEFLYVSLDELLKKSDFISLHIPLIPQTHYLISEKEIRKMKNGVILVNTSRGAIVDTKALIKYIAKFKAVCFDVLENETKLTKNNPLLQYQNIIITPHIAFYTDDSIKKIAKETEICLNKFLSNNKEGKII